MTLLDGLGWFWMVWDITKWYTDGIGWYCGWFGKTVNGFSIRSCFWSSGNQWETFFHMRSGKGRTNEMNV